MRFKLAKPCSAGLFQCDKTATEDDLPVNDSTDTKTYRSISSAWFGGLFGVTADSDTNLYRFIIHGE